jgi:hypothetical protein
MGDFKKNPKRPLEVLVPNKIRKRVAMHYEEATLPKRLESISRVRKALALPTVPDAPKRGSMWSRFTGGIKNFVQNKITKRG